MIIFPGGIPLKKEGEVVGAIGVSGGPGNWIMPSQKPEPRPSSRLHSKLSTHAH